MYLVVFELDVLTLYLHCMDGKICLFKIKTSRKPPSNSHYFNPFISK
jgi:hypothetical protein